MHRGPNQPGYHLQSRRQLAALGVQNSETARIEDGRLPSRGQAHPWLGHISYGSYSGKTKAEYYYFFLSGIYLADRGGQFCPPNAYVLVQFPEICVCWHISIYIHTYIATHLMDILLHRHYYVHTYITHKYVSEHVWYMCVSK